MAQGSAGTVRASTRGGQRLDGVRRSSSRSTAQKAVADNPTSSSSGAGLDRGVYNFSAGPACLPVEVLQRAQADLLSWNGSGMSVMEMSHRGEEYSYIHQKAKDDLCELLNVPDNYRVLFMQGGASTQFACVPLNLAKPDDVADYVVTGSWGVKAEKEARKYCSTNIAATDEQNNFTHIPKPSEWSLSNDPAYVHICHNETIQGVEFKGTPDVGSRTLVADMSSNFLSKPINVSDYGVIYAGAQKNVGPSGVTIVIVREDLIGKQQQITPTMLDWQVMAESDSLHNTPPCFAVYMCGLVFQHLKQRGGLAKVEQDNIEKAQQLYSTIDESNGFYQSPQDPEVRSNMNVPFTIGDAELEKKFIKEAAERDLVQLKGHRSVGGMRASIYNAMPTAGIEKLIDFMKEFQKAHG